MSGENEFELEKIVLLESGIDHLTGEEVGAALNALNEMPEILDASWHPGIGKKNRPCGLLRALCRPEHEACAVAAFFRHTHTLGVRRALLERYVLQRRAAAMPESGLAAKAYSLEGEEYLRPEADGLSRLAREKGVGLPAMRIVKKPA